MKRLLWVLSLIVLVGCVTPKLSTNVYYEQSTSHELIDSVARAENWDIPNYKNWEYSIYLGVAEHDTTVVKVYNFWQERNKAKYIFSVTEVADTLYKVNFRKEQ